MIDRREDKGMLGQSLQTIAFFGDNGGFHYRNRRFLLQKKYPQFGISVLDAPKIVLS